MSKADSATMDGGDIRDVATSRKYYDAGLQAERLLCVSKIIPNTSRLGAGARFRGRAPLPGKPSLGLGTR